MTGTTLVDDPAPARGARRGPRVAAGVLLLLGGVAAVVAAVLTGGGSAAGPDDRGPDATATTGPSATTAPGPPTGSPAPAVGAPVVPGSPCDFTLVGQRRPTATGTATCTYASSATTWTADP